VAGVVFDRVERGVRTRREVRAIISTTTRARTREDARGRARGCAVHF
jgi:hypothetical protein